jgi:putative ATP-dependent endonuclease of the OLD family
VARIRAIEIKHFRGIEHFAWLPGEGINCLIGPGDSCKTAILDAIDLCLGARRNVPFTDADFHELDVDTPISITVSIGDLGDSLKSLEPYGLYVRGFVRETGAIEDEPEKSSETVLTINLTVGSDLEPIWTLVSERAKAQEQSRNIAWADRLKIAPTRLGAISDYNLGWRRGSVLNRLSEERADASAALAKAARDARAAFGDQAEKQLSETLGIVAATAAELGVPVGKGVRAMLDAHSVSFSGGTISLHSDSGVPLRGLGVGSTRLLIAGLQRRAATEASIVIIDELEHGLEPHRIVRLLGSIGSKDKPAPLQAFVTTHSPVALRELSGLQLTVIRKSEGSHSAKLVGDADDVQSTIRLYPDAFLAPSVIVCEGASEVGLLRGLDQHRTSGGRLSMTALGVGLIDAVGVDKIYKRATCMLELGYRVATLRDDDVKPNAEDEAKFDMLGGNVVCWQAGRKLEDELFMNLSSRAIDELVEYAVELHGVETIDRDLSLASGGKFSYADLVAGDDEELRTALGKASSRRKAGWFKSVSWMEEAARGIIGPDLDECDTGFAKEIERLFEWMAE